MANKWEIMLHKDIAKCEEAMGRNDNDELYRLYELLYPKYLNQISGLNHGISGEREDAFSDIEFIKEMMEMQMAIIEQQEKYDSLKQSNVLINANNTNNNTNTNSMSVKVSFDEAKKEVENMSSLTDLEIEEVLKKIEELEQIVLSKDRRSKKWENAKGIIKWIADKGVDVGISLLPLLMQI